MEELKDFVAMQSGIVRADTGFKDAANGRKEIIKAAKKEGATV